MQLRTITASFVLLFTAITVRGATPAEMDVTLDGQFKDTVLPFVNNYCVTCHSGDKPKAQFDIKPYSAFTTVTKDEPRWAVIREKLFANDMPPEEAKNQPSPEARQKIIAWIDAQRKNEAQKHAGDPGIVLARRLSNAEYDNTVRDLTGVDLKPTKEFPVDPANAAGFDNSGETLAMTPSLLNKYLKAARDIASHMYLKQQGFAFASRSMMSETDRDKVCENQIIDLYHRNNTDYADYFQAAWQYKNRAALGKPNGTIESTAMDFGWGVSAKYLQTVWDLLESTKEDVGPVAKIQSMWKALPAPDKSKTDIERPGVEAMRDWVISLRGKVEPRFSAPPGGRGGGEAMPMWINTQYATHRRTFDAKQLQVAGEEQAEAAAPPVAAAGRGRGGGGRGGRGNTITNAPGDPDLTVPAGQRAAYEKSFTEFCSVFPDRFYTQERSTNYFNEGNDTGRYLSAGFLNRMGYFRDDQPFYELVLDEKQQKQLDTYWRDMDFIASTTRRTYLQSFDPGSGQARAILGDGNASPDDNLVTPENIKKYADGQSASAGEEGAKIIQDYYQSVNDTIRWSEKARIEAEPSQVTAVMDFAARAYRRPMTKAEQDDLLDYYKSAREKDHLTHEEAIRDSIAYVLMAPEMTYRVDLAAGDSGIHPLSDYDLASRLSYFLWSSMPDAELLSHAAAKDLHDPKVIVAQAQRMMKDPRALGMATEFGGNWLEIRRFQEINTVDHDKFPSFTNDLRDAMYEEPVRFVLDVVQNNRSVLDFLYANDTFVNPVLAKHYGMPDVSGNNDHWIHVTDADKYDRGGLLPMAAFLTKYAPGLRTSPVKRGHWMVKNILGEQIAPPPAGVPVIPQDDNKIELSLPQMLAKHRADPSCAGCHARFDSLGLVFEGFGPIGEKRDKDLAGRAIENHATFPDGTEGTGLEGVRKYIREHRQDEYIDTLCGRLLVYALGRSLISSDEVLIDDIHHKLAADGYKFDIIVESIITSPQFLNKRGRDGLAER